MKYMIVYMNDMVGMYSYGMYNSLEEARKDFEYDRMLARCQYTLVDSCEDWMRYHDEKNDITFFAELVTLHF